MSSKWITVTHHLQDRLESIDIDLKGILPVIRESRNDRTMFVIFIEHHVYQISADGREAVLAGIDESEVKVRHSMIGGSYYAHPEQATPYKIVAWDAKTDMFTFENGTRTTYLSVMKHTFDVQQNGELNHD